MLTPALRLPNMRRLCERFARCWGFSMNASEKRMNRDAWITVARACFEPGKRMSCSVCNKYSGLAQAHHLIPLSIQAKAEPLPDIPDDSFVWLCPTHHVAVHILIGQMNSKKVKASKACSHMLADMERDEIEKILDIANQAWR